MRQPAEIGFRPAASAANTHLDPGHGLLSLHHARRLGGLTLAHQLRGAEVARAEENAFDEHCGVAQQVCK
jgi:hypothetical protein